LTDGRTQEQTAYQLSPVEFHKYPGQLFGLEGATANITPDLVDAVSTVVDADVGQEDFEETDGTATGQSRPMDKAQGVAATESEAAVAADIILSGGDQCLQFTFGIHLSTGFEIIEQTYYIKKCGDVQGANGD